MPTRIDENTNRRKPFGEVGTVRENVTETRLGQRVLVTPMPGYNLNCYVPPPGLGLSRPDMLFPQSLLRVTEHDLQDLSYLPGQWALTLDGRPTTSEVSPHYPGTAPVASLMAKVSFGSGAAAHLVELDAVRNTIILPSLDVVVDVGISQVIGSSGLDLSLFAEYEVKGVIQRVGGSAAFKPATRSYICADYFPTMPIPKFADSWCYVTNSALAFGDIITSADTTLWYNDDPSSNPSLAEAVPGDIVSQNSRMHCFRTLHPLAKSISIPTLPQDGGPGAIYPGTMVFNLDF